MKEKIQDKVIAIIKEEMANKGISIYRVCKDTGLTISSISNILKGKKNTSYRTLQCVIDYLEIKIEVTKYN